MAAGAARVHALQQLRAPIHGGTTLPRPAPRHAAVQTDGTRVDDFASQHIVDDRLIVYHYITKSEEASWAGDQGQAACGSRGLHPLCSPSAGPPHAQSGHERRKMPSCAPLPALPRTPQDYAVKMARGDGMGMKQRKQEYFKTVQKQ